MSDFYIHKKDWDRIINYARAREQECGDEIGGMAVIIKDKDDDYIIKEPTILKQETTGSTCTLDKDELAQYYADMAHKYGNDLQFLWWHSHAKMAAFWSGTDTNTMTEYKNSHWSAFLVVNVREEYKFRVQYWHPYEIGEDIELNIMTNKAKERAIPKAILKEIEDKCSERVISSYKHTHNSYSYNGYGQATLWNNQAKERAKSAGLEELIDEYESSELTGYSYHGVGATIQESPISFLVEQLEQGNEKYCEGSITYEKYAKAIQEFNDTLEKLEGNNEPRIRVILFDKPLLLDKCMQLFPGDFITVDGTSIRDLALQKEVSEYNGTFGGKI